MTNPLLPAGYELLTKVFSFSSVSGPLYYNAEKISLGFVSEEKHLNLAGFVHGGMLATLADVGLYCIAGEGYGSIKAVTVSLNLNYLSSVPNNCFVYCNGRIVRRGKTIVFINGSIYAEEKEVVTFQGILKNI